MELESPAVIAQSHTTTETRFRTAGASACVAIAAILLAVSGGLSWSTPDGSGLSYGLSAASPTLLTAFFLGTLVAFALTALSIVSVPPRRGQLIAVAFGLIAALMAFVFVIGQTLGDPSWAGETLDAGPWIAFLAFVSLATGLATLIVPRVPDPDGE